MILIGEKKNREEYNRRLPDVMTKTTWLNKPVKIEDLIPAVEEISAGYELRSSKAC